MTRFKMLLAGAALALSSTTALAQDFTTGKTITIISGGTGGYDAYARLLGRHMNRFLPGEPTVIVKNMPAAASMAAANVIYNATAPDGLTFGSFLRQIPFAPLLGDASAKYDAQKFTWIGTSSHFLDDVSLFFVRKELGIRSMEELRARKQPLNFGSAGRTSTGDESARLIGPVLGLDLKIIRGYGGSPQILMAMESGEADAMILGISSLSSTKPDWLKPGHAVNFLFQFGYGGEGRHPQFPDVPRLDELATTPEAKGLFYLLQVPFKVARPFAAPPGVPAERAKVLREAFMKTNQDAQYLEEAKKLKIDISPLSGEAVAAAIAEAYKLPAELVARYGDILAKAD